MNNSNENITLFKENHERINNLGPTYQKSIDARLGGLRLRVLNKSEFEEDIGNHGINQISFVKCYDGDHFSHFELYKGDVLILPKGGPTPTYAFGKVVRINTAYDNPNRYYGNQRYGLSGYIPAGESISGTAIGFNSDSGSGTFIYPTEDNRIQLGICNSSPSAIFIEGCSKLSIKISHGNSEETMTYELMQLNLTPARTGNIRIPTPYVSSIMIRINGTYYYVGNKDNVEYWPGNITSSGSYGAIEATFKDSDVGYSNYKDRCGLFLSMPNVHGYNLAQGAEQFEARIGFWTARYTSAGAISSRSSYILHDTNSPYHRLGLRYSLADGTDLGTPTFKECFIPGKSNYEDFLDIARIICVPFKDTNGNEVHIYDS